MFGRGTLFHTRFRFGSKARGLNHTLSGILFGVCLVEPQAKRAKALGVGRQLDNCSVISLLLFATSLSFLKVV